MGYEFLCDSGMISRAIFVQPARPTIFSSRKFYVFLRFYSAGANRVVARVALTSWILSFSASVAMFAHFPPILLSRGRAAPSSREIHSKENYPTLRTRRTSMSGFDLIQVSNHRTLTYRFPCDVTDRFRRDVLAVSWLYHALHRPRNHHRCFNIDMAFRTIRILRPDPRISRFTRYLLRKWCKSKFKVMTWVLAKKALVNWLTEIQNIYYKKKIAMFM